MKRLGVWLLPALLTLALLPPVARAREEEQWITVGPAASPAYESFGLSFQAIRWRMDGFQMEFFDFYLLTSDSDWNNVIVGGGLYGMGGDWELGRNDIYMGFLFYLLGGGYAGGGDYKDKALAGLLKVYVRLDRPRDQADVEVGAFLYYPINTDEEECDEWDSSCEPSDKPEGPFPLVVTVGLAW